MVVCALASTAFSASAAYELTVTVGYGFGGSSTSGAYSAAPDTGYVIVQNTGPSAFVGEIRLDAPYPGGSFADTTGLSYSLNPGSSFILLPGPESSNFGGYNKVSGSDDNGVLLSIVGSAGGDSINFSIFDKDVHSGVFKTNPFGVTLDNYILQGGDPIGRDTGDDFEVNQAPATFRIASRTSSVPDAGNSITLLGAGLVGVTLLRKRLAA